MMRNFLSSATFFRDFFAWQKPVNHGFEAMWTSKHSFMPYRSNHENSGGLLAAGENMYFVDGHVRWIRLDDGTSVLQFACSRRKTLVCREYRYATEREDGRASWP